MSTTIKPTETPELELVSVAEDALVQNDEQILDNIKIVNAPPFCEEELKRIDAIVDSD